MTPRLLALSSGLSPCGIADYHAALVAAMGGSAHATTVRLPADLAPRSRPWRLLARRAWVKRLARRAAEFDAVLVQYHPRLWNYAGRRGEDLFPVFMAAVRRPVVAVVHEAAEPIGEGPDRGNPVARAVKGLNRKAFERLNRAGPPGAALAGCAAAVVHTGELRDWLTGLGLPPDRARHVLHPVFPLAPPAWTPAEVDARFGLGGRRVVAMVGFPDPRKGFDAAVRAVAGLPPDVVLAWAGGSRGCAVEAGLLDLAAELGMGDRFRRLGYLSEPELTAVLLRADVAVAPFRQVTGSGSVARLVAAGVPVIATDLRPLRELRDAGAGVELVTGDAVAVRAAVAAVLTDGQLADDLRAANCAFSAARGFGALAEEVLRAVREARPGGGRADREFAGPRTVSVPNATWSGK